ncbi:hypothetical protein SLE2022_294310 [Rubroshorea leprosula]
MLLIVSNNKDGSFLFLLVQGLTKAGLIPKEENRVDVENNAAPYGLTAIYNVFQPLLRVKMRVWGRRPLLVTLPIHSLGGHYGYRSCRSVKEESLELGERLEKLSMYLERAEGGDLFWSNILRITIMVPVLLTLNPSLMDMSANEIYVQQFKIPRNIILKAISCMWMPDRETTDVIFHFKFNPIASLTNNGKEHGTMMHVKPCLHSILL